MEKILKLTEKQKYLIKELSELTDLYKHLVKEKGENEARQWKFTLIASTFIISMMLFLANLI